MSTQVKKTISILMFATVCLVFGGIVNQRAEASVCFLPDDSMCDEEGVSSTKDYGFWPGGSGNGKTTSSCDSSYNSSRGGSNCTQCKDKTSRYYGYYKCGDDVNCDDYTSTESVNECGERCDKCMISNDKNYGKYKCSKDCDSCADYTDELPADYNDPNACQAKVCEACPTDNTKYKCTDRTEVCPEGNYQSNLTAEQIEKHCEPACDICYDEHFEQNICDTCFGKDYTEDDCPSGYKVEGDYCTGKENKKFYDRCCNKCEGYNYSSNKTGNGWSCTKCENACGEDEKWKCICTPVTCPAVTIPANAHGTTTCKTRDEACQEGEEVYTAWDCNNGYTKQGSGCVKDTCDSYTPTFCYIDINDDNMPYHFEITDIRCEDGISRTPGGEIQLDYTYERHSNTNGCDVIGISDSTAEITVVINEDGSTNESIASGMIMVTDDAIDNDIRYQGDTRYSKCAGNESRCYNFNPDTDFNDGGYNGGGYAGSYRSLNYCYTQTSYNEVFDSSLKQGKNDDTNCKKVYWKTTNSESIPEVDHPAVDYATLIITRNVSGFYWPDSTENINEEEADYVWTYPYIDFCGQTLDLYNKSDDDNNDNWSSENNYTKTITVDAGKCNITYAGAWEVGKNECFMQGWITINGKTLGFTGLNLKTGSSYEVGPLRSGGWCYSSVGENSYTFEAGKTYTIIVNPASLVPHTKNYH